MNITTVTPQLAAMLGGWEVIVMLMAALLCPAVIITIVVLVIWYNKRPAKPTPPAPIQPPPPATAATRKFCHTCGKEISGDAPQGLCPACLMKSALGSESGNPAASGERKPAASIEEIAKHFPQLEILELLGQGGMGVVYKARQRQLDRLVALKVMPPEAGRDPAFAERFTREAKALARLNHPNIVAVYDFGQSDGLYFVLMEYVDGLNLRQVERTRRLAPKEALEIIPKICEALQFAHDQGIVHRDIKPENILLDKQGRVKIADFGIAKLLGQTTQDFRLTDAGRIMGTPHYMAPEQVEHPLDVDHRADIYSLGVVFYEMLTGELPLGKFAAPSQKVQMDVRLDEVVLKTLEKEPQRRYQHVSEVKTHVETIAGGPSRLSAPTPPPKEDRFWKRFAVGIALAVAALILIPIAAILLSIGLPAWYRAQARVETIRSHVGYEFGPLVERTLHFGEFQPSGIAFVNLEKAEVMQPPFAVELDPNSPISTLKHNPRLDEWIAASGVDLAVHLREKNWALVPLWTRLVFQEDERERDMFWKFKVEAAGSILNSSTPPKGYFVSKGVGVESYPASGNFLLKTRREVIGLMQLSGFTNATRGVKLTYRLAQEVKASQVASSPRVVFGPVRERVLNDLDDQRGGEALNLRTGQLQNLPADFRRWTPQTRQDWLTTNRLDLLMDFAKGQWAIMRREVTLSDFPAEQWDTITTTALTKALQQETALPRVGKPGAVFYLLGEHPQTPLTFAFRSRDGDEGLLQITGFTDQPRGVKLRYKLVQDATRRIDEPSALFSPVADPRLGDSAYRLISSLSKPAHAVLAEVELVLVDGPVPVTFPNPVFSFFQASPAGISNSASRITWSFTEEVKGKGAWNLHIVGEMESQRFERDVRPAPKAASWTAVPPKRSFWVGPGEWHAREWNVLPLFEARDEKQQVIARLQLKLLVSPLPAETVADLEKPLLLDQDWKQAPELENILDAPSRPGAVSENKKPLPSYYTNDFAFRFVASANDMNTPADELVDPNTQTKLRVAKEVLLDSSDVRDVKLTSTQGDHQDILIQLTAAGAKKMAAASSTNLGRRLAIVWQGRVLTAPTIQSPLTGSAINISGRFSDTEIRRLFDVLNHR